MGRHYQYIYQPADPMPVVAQPNVVALIDLDCDCFNGLDFNQA